MLWTLLLKRQLAAGAAARGGQRKASKAKNKAVRSRANESEDYGVLRMMGPLVWRISVIAPRALGANLKVVASGNVGRGIAVRRNAIT